MKKKLLLGIFVIGIVLCFSLIKTQAITTLLILEDQSIESSIISLSPGSPKLLDLSLVPHEPITIINDGNFSDYGFQGTIEWSSFMHEMGHNFTLNSPADYYYGGKIDGNANAIFSESLAQIFQHATAFEIINNYSDYVSNSTT